MLITCLARAVLATAVTAIAAAAAVEHTRDVQPIFQKRCYGCHGASQEMGGLRLDRREAALRV